MGFERTVHSGVATTSIALGQLEDINPALSAAASDVCQKGFFEAATRGEVRAAGRKRYDSYKYNSELFNK